MSSAAAGQKAVVENKQGGEGGAKKELATSVNAITTNAVLMVSEEMPAGMSFMKRKRRKKEEEENRDIVSLYFLCFICHICRFIFSSLYVCHLSSSLAICRLSCYIFVASSSSIFSIYLSLHLLWLLFLYASHMSAIYRVLFCFFFRSASSPQIFF